MGAHLMTIIRITLKVCLASLIAFQFASIAQAAIVFDNAFNFRENRVNPPLNFTQGPDLIIIGVDVIDTNYGVAPKGALVGAENSVTGEKLFLNFNSPVRYSRAIPYTQERASGTWIIGVTSDVGSAMTLIGGFGTGPGTGPMPGVDNLAIVSGEEPMFSWVLPPGLPSLNDGNVDRIRVRIQDSNGSQILNNTVDDTTLTATAYTTPSGVVTHNGAYVGSVLVEGLTPFNRSRTYETFVVDTVGTGGTPVSNNLFYYRDNRRANSVRFGEGDRLVVGNNVFPFDDTYVYAENGDTIVPLSQAREANRRFEFASSFAYDSGLTGPWTIVAWNGAVETTVVTHAVGAVPLLPFVDNIRMLPDFLEPTIEWDLPPSGTFDNVQIGLFNDVTDERLSVFGPFQDQLFETLPVDTTSYKFKPGALQEKQKYVVRILLRDRNLNGNTVNRSLTFFNFSPIMMESTTPVFLPSLSPGGVYNFDFDVTAGFPVTIDPHVAIGYEYVIGEGDPRFATVTLPLVGDGIYDLVLFDNMDNPLPAIPLMANVLFDFTTEVGPSGVDKFLILGIEASASLDPADSTAFMTTLTFTGSGRFTGTMTPITESVSTTFNLVDVLNANVQTLTEDMKLTKTLDKVLKLVGKDSISDACNQLDKFIKDVNKLIKIGELDAEDGEPLPLIEQAEVIKSVVGC